MESSTSTEVESDPQQSDRSSKPVQMRLRPHTLDRIERLQWMMKTKNRTQTVVQAIELAEWLVTTVKEGSEIRVRHEDGTEERVKLVGI
jgi:truncated hemoglobin YjbI